MSQGLFEPLSFQHGPAMKNRLMLAPLTNGQSHADGTLSEDEFRWLTMRAQGGFGLTMTCASHVQAQGQGFAGQLGVFSDVHLEGLTRLATAIRSAGSLSSVQLHHAGVRSPKALVPEPVGPSDDPETGARGLFRDEVEELIEDFVGAAERAERAGFDGVEIHGAHGYILSQFLSQTVNLRKDNYGGSLENRSRIIFEIIDGIRRRCRSDFQLGLRLSPERFGLQLAEVREVAQAVLKDRRVDYLDMSLWDPMKDPEEDEFKGRPLMSYFLDLERAGVRLGLAGKVSGARAASDLVAAGADFVLVGKAAIVYHDFPERTRQDPEFKAALTPVSRARLLEEGVSTSFIEYLRPWSGLVAKESD